MSAKRYSGVFKAPALPPRKRQRTDIRRPVAASYPDNSFKGLPLELREEIYRHIFNDLVAEPSHAYSITPENDSFQAYTTLRLVDRATAAEAKRVFEKEGYLDRIVLYFDEVPSLHDAYFRLVQSFIFPHVQFQLRARNDENLTDEAVREDIEEFIGYQPGFEEDWLDWPGFYGERPSAPQDDHPERSSFRFKQHSACDSGEECIPYQEIVFPPLQNHLKICSYRWTVRSANTRPAWRHVDIGIMTMRGKLKDIIWKGYPVRIARKNAFVLPGHGNASSCRRQMRFISPTL